jgi:hypothetical protein
MKSFIITIDTEGDNLWDYRMDSVITTKFGKIKGCFMGITLKDYHEKRTNT